MDIINGVERFEEVEDMITLPNLTEESLLTNLKIRYARREIYTYTGSILVAVNPYEILPIYTPEIVKSYFSKQRGSLPPHIFAIADAAYSNMLEDRKNQSIIISGESGAGKTESTKLIIQYLAARTNKHSQVEQMIVESSPILEAFGNAKTVRNNNSSRFGKFIEIQFNTSGHICGARIINYLLEKSRISSQAQSERNYHIFYQLLAGASDALKTKLSLGEPEEYHYLNQSGCIRIDRINDAEDFEHVRYAMSVLGLPEDKQDTIFAILAAILHLGNLQFEKYEKTPGAEGSRVVNQDILKIVANLLQLDPVKLETCLTIRHVLIKGQNFVIPLKMNEAEDTRDSFSKALYGNVFNWLVTFINSRIHKPQPNSTFIGVLDIFGFENFKKNSFEQFCINFANEKLQQHFNQHIFKLEQEEYEKEKINWSKITYNDNQECLDLIEKRPLGILSLLDEECRFPQASDNTLLEKLHANHEKHAYYEKPKRSKTTFVVKHYAGEVSYDTQGFLDKNKDTLSDDLLLMLQQCKNKFIVELFAVAKESNDGDDDKGATMKKKTTAGSQFKVQLQSLVNTLSSTAPHYVRCVKPNSLKEPLTFDDELVQAQLRYAGMMETIRIRKTGFPIRHTHKEFRDRYLLLDIAARAADHKSTCANLISRVNPSTFEGILSDEWQLGLTKVFIRDPQYRKLEEHRKLYLVKHVTKIQATWRMFRLKKKFKAIRAVSLVLQTAIRSANARRELIKTRRAATVIQSFWKMVKARRQYLKTLSDVRELQCGVRAFLARKKAHEHFKTKRERAQRLAEIAAAEKTAAERQRMEAEERERQAKEDSAKAESDRKRVAEEKIAREQAEKVKKDEEQAKKAQEKKEQLAELKQLDEIASLQSKLQEQQSQQIEDLDNVFSMMDQFSFEGGVGADDTLPYTYNAKMYEMSADALEKISLTDLLLGLKQTVQTVTKMDVDDSKFSLPAGIENVLKRLPPPTPNAKQPSSRPVPVPGTTGDAAPIPMSSLNGDLPPPPPIPARGNRSNTNDEDEFPPPPPPMFGLPPPPPPMFGEFPPPPPPMFGEFPPPPPPPASLAGLFVPTLGAPPPPPPSSASGASGSNDSAAATPATATAHTTAKQSNLKPLISDEEISLYSFYDFANKHFNAEKHKQKEDLFTYQKSFIKSSLLAHESSEVVKVSVEIFAKIQSYLTSKKQSDSSEHHFAPVKYILAKGLATESIRDEIYCQLIKQSTNTPTLEMRLRVWELIHFVCATFVPTRKFIKYAVSYIKNTANTETAAKSVKDTASACYTILQRFNHTIVPRKMVPSITELEALRELRPIFVRITMMDGSFKGYYIDSATSCAEASNELAIRAHLRPTNHGFSLVESVNGIERDLSADDKVADILSRVESLQATMSAKLNINFKIYFKKRLFMAVGDNNATEVESDLILQQVYSDLLNGHFFNNNEFLLSIGAMRLQMDSGDITEDIVSWLPGNGRGKYYTPDVEKHHFEEFINKYRANKGLSQEDAKKKLIDLVYHHPLASRSLFKCEHNCDMVSYPKSFILALNITDIEIFDSTSLKSSATIRYSAVSINNIKVNPNNKSLTMNIEGRVNFEFQCSDAARVVALIKDYAILLRNSAKFARALRDYNVNDDTLLSFKRNDIITIVMKDQDNKWYIGSLNGREGSFPVDHVEILLTDQQPSASSSSPASDSAPTSPAVSSPMMPPRSLPTPPPTSASSSPSSASPSLPPRSLPTPPPPPPMSSTPPPPPVTTSSGRSLPPPPPAPPAPTTSNENRRSLPTPPPMLSTPPPPMLSTPPTVSTPPMSIATPPPPPPPSNLSLSPVLSAPPPPPTMSTPPPMLSTPSPPPPMLSTPPPPPPARLSTEQPATRGVSTDMDNLRASSRMSVGPASEAETGTLGNWAQTKFRTLKRNSMAPSGTIKKKSAPADPNAVLYFTKDPIKESLLELADSKHSKKACHLFQLVMIYMGDYPLSKSATYSSVAQEIIETGIQTPELRDEIYCQVYRQTNRNPKPDSVRRGFELLQFLSISYPPTESLLSVFVEQLMARHIAVQSSNNVPLSQAIQSIIERIEAHPVGLQRKHGPSTIEIQSLRNLDEIPTCKIRALSQTTIAVKLESYSTAKELAGEALTQFGISSAMSKNFGLYQMNDMFGVCRPLGDNDLIYDVMTSWEQLADNDKRINPADFYFQVRRKYYLDDIVKILDQEHLWTTDETAFELTFLQIREEWMRGMYWISERDISYAASILIQLAYPNQSKLQISNKDLLKQVIPDVLFQGQNIKFWSSNIETHIFELVSHTQEYLKLLFLQQMGKSALFGCTLFNVTQKENPPKAILAIGKKGVSIFDATSPKDAKNFWTYQNISNWTISDNSFVIMTGNLMKPVKNSFASNELTAISSVYQFYSN
ncbi:class VII unconventional myosin [Heterostelium album PN500]|uniref:Class VII unconventional myosin n=1 Tax=Heterostelium pallidum (strain ATCC 26659 / Pp 5 / PN500) TaxID=670386 RepID=D3BST1_HETP5|nr:class VII unconventional myosin [Heterostelium album PN500]EFA75546.1 class VII unconventional myosin [Heterostelium album PN500]|eukprot:XP_020427680.1 class VII unconventional myosin [Heterostelium album PN500]